MTTIADKLNKRLKLLAENLNTAKEFIDPRNPNYDRQYAEDILFHTIGPLTSSPRWSERWTSPSDPVPGFMPGGPAPQWTPDEIVMAMAGDPNLLFRGREHPRSPSYGRQGGSPLYRTARRVARVYNRDRDRSFIADMYSNGFVPLVRMMQPGFDESKSPFISYVIRNIQGAMEHGVGGTEQGIQARGAESTAGVTGLRGMLEKTNPQEVEDLANQVKGKFRTERSHAKDPDNPFGGYSSRYYQVGINYADALRSGNEDRIHAAQNQIEQLIDQIETEAIPVLGASTGMGQAVSTPSRRTSVGVRSIDVPTGDDEGTAAGSIAAPETEEEFLDPSTVQFILEIALKQDAGQIIGGSQTLAKRLASAGVDVGEVKGRLTAAEFRYVIRQLGPSAASYPGKGKLRSSAVPRESMNWWKPGEDPEIEQIPGGAIWHSIWARNNYPHFGPTEIAQEMTEEVREFAKLGIRTARKIKPKVDARSGRSYEEAVSKVAVNNQFQIAVKKLKAIAILYRPDLGLDESALLRKHQFPLLEDVDQTDRALIIETLNKIIIRLQRTIASVVIEEFTGRTTCAK